MFCKRSQVILKDERPTSNIERPTSNEKRISNTEHPTAIYDLHRTIEQPFFQVCFFIFSHSTFDVGRSMFDVH